MNSTCVDQNVQMSKLASVAVASTKLQGFSHHGSFVMGCNSSVSTISTSFDGRLLQCYTALYVLQKVR